MDEVVGLGQFYRSLEAMKDGWGTQRETVCV